MWLKRLLVPQTEKEQQVSQSQIVAEPTSHELVFEEIKSRLSAQQSNVEKLNIKANALIGFGGVIFAVLLGTQASWLALSELPRVFAVLGGCLLMFSIVFAYRGYSLKSYRSDPDPRSLAERYRSRPVGETREMLMANLIDTFEFNERVIRTSTVQVRYSYRLQLAAIVLLAVASLFGVLSDFRTF